MTKLKELIQFWNYELNQGSQRDNPTRQGMIRATILYLENLTELLKEK